VASFTKGFLITLSLFINPIKALAWVDTATGTVPCLSSFVAIVSLGKVLLPIAPATLKVE